MISNVSPLNSMTFMATKAKLVFKPVEQVVSDDGRKVTTVSEASYAHGVLVRVESEYKNRDGNMVIAEAVTFVPSLHELKK